MAMGQRLWPKRFNARRGKQSASGAGSATPNIEILAAATGHEVTEAKRRPAQRAPPSGAVDPPFSTSSTPCNRINIKRPLNVSLRDIEPNYKLLHYIKRWRVADLAFELSLLIQILVYSLPLSSKLCNCSHLFPFANGRAIKCEHIIPLLVSHTGQTIHIWFTENSGTMPNTDTFSYP
jgi:hypothetical protein